MLSLILCGTKVFENIPDFWLSWASFHPFFSYFYDVQRSPIPPSPFPLSLSRNWWSMKQSLLISREREGRKEEKGRDWAWRKKRRKPTSSCEHSFLPGQMRKSLTLDYREKVYIAIGKRSRLILNISKYFLFLWAIEWGIPLQLFHLRLVFRLHLRRGEVADPKSNENDKSKTLEYLNFHKKDFFKINKITSARIDSRWVGHRPSARRNRRWRSFLYIAQVINTTRFFMLKTFLLWLYLLAKYYSQSMHHPHRNQRVLKNKTEWIK